MSAPLTPERLGEIRARLARATPGPWRWAPYDGGSIHFLTNQPAERDDPYRAPLPRIHSDGSAWGEYSADIDVDGPDAALIAAAPQDIADLLAEVERLRADVARLEWLTANGYVTGLRRYADDSWSLEVDQNPPAEYTIVLTEGASWREAVDKAMQEASHA